MPSDYSDGADKAGANRHWKGYPHCAPRKVRCLARRVPLSLSRPRYRVGSPARRRYKSLHQSSGWPLGNQLSAKTAQAQSVIDDTTSQINKLNSNESSINRKISDFERVTTNLQNASSSIALKQGRKNEIPTLLNQIVYTIPKNVQLTSIKDTETEVDGETKQHISIVAQSKQYEQLAYFKAKLSNSGYLLNVTSTEGTKTGEYVVVTIEGDLP